MSIQELADKAIDFIIDTQIENDYICDCQDAVWCETHCIDHLRKECVIKFLEDYELQHEECQ